MTKILIGIVALVAIIGGGLYLFKNNSKTADTSTIEWQVSNAGEVDNIPYSNVTAVINGKKYDMGKFQGSCSEIGATGGVDGKGLLAGELSATQCWFAGFGNEIGIFTHEQGGVDIMVGDLSEGDAETLGYRGNFRVEESITF